MPSRRNALAALGSAATLSLAGCLDVVHAPSAYCQLKAVLVEWEHETRRYRDQVVQTVGEPGDVRGRVAEELSGLASGPRDLVVDDAAAEDLDVTFLAVDYVLGFCGDAFDGCRNTRADSRASFNAVQVGDEARVTLADNTFRVHATDPPSDDSLAEWETAFSRFDFSAFHADHGEPLGDRS